MHVEEPLCHVHQRALDDFDGSSATCGDLLPNFFGILDDERGDAVVVAFQRYFIDVLENPNAFLHPTHALDYMNVVMSWTRDYDNPHQVKAIFMGARFMNDTIRSNTTACCNNCLASITAAKCRSPTRAGWNTDESDCKISTAGIRPSWYTSRDKVTIDCK